MTDKVQKIKDWISKTQDGLMDANGNFENPSEEGAFHILSNLDYYIDSLQEESVSEKKCMFTKDIYTDEDRKVLCEDCEEKCEYSKKEELVSEDLEEAASRYTKEEYDRKNPATLPDRCRGCYAPLIYAFKAGAKWGKKQAMAEIQAQSMALAHRCPKEEPVSGDLEKELKNWRHNHFHGRRDMDATGEYLERSSQLDIAHHFARWQKGKTISKAVEWLQRNIDSSIWLMNFKKSMEE